MKDADPLKSWFCEQILPFEAALTRFIRRNWRNESDISELRQEIYVLIYERAQQQLPAHGKAYLFATARNHLINRARREQIVSFETVADLEGSTVLVDTVTPDQQLSGRQELKRLQIGLNRLPPRCREVVVLRKIEGLSQKQVAERMGVGVHSVERQMVRGMRALVDFVLGGHKPHKRRVRSDAAARVRP